MFRFLLSLLIIIPCTLRACYTDIKNREIEHLTVLVMLLAFWGKKVKIAERVIAILLPFLLKPFFGFGDILLFSVLGFDLGLKNIFIVFAVSTLISGVFCAYKLIIHTYTFKKEIAFAPFIAIGLLFVIFKEIIALCT